ncbi:MAG: 3D domain-containing protein [Syntrophorhabdaceae bacterium]|nr:3D domain-containing protein [Syntrophorhabdaceae bacterium]
MNAQSKKALYWLIFITVVTVAGRAINIEAYDRGGEIFGDTEEFCTVAGDSDDSSQSAESGTCSDEKRGLVREVSAYNSVPEQTDASPCISADGTDICRRYKKGECIVATNAYPLRTRLRIDKVGDCTVADRTHVRYSHRVDLFMDKDIEGAVNFGVQKLTVIELAENM